MAAKSETNLTTLESNIKTATIEVERIEGVIAALDVTMDKAHKSLLAHEKEATAERNQADIYGGMAELGKLDSGLKDKFLVVKAKLLSLGEAKKALPSLGELNEKKRLILAALTVEKDKLHEMELLYPEAVRAVDLDRAEKELVIFMELSAKLAESVVKLAVLNESLDEAIFYSGAPFVIPMPTLQPFRDQAENKIYHQDNGDYSFFNFSNTLKAEIIAAGGMQWAL